MEIPYLVLLFFLTALIYSMAGFGGGSTYIAILILFAFPFEAIPKVALLCNLVVTLSGFFLFLPHFSARKVLPFVVTSIPSSFLAGTLPIERQWFSILLGFSLLAAAVRMFLSEELFVVRKEVTWKTAWLVGLPMGALLGGLSGLVGIGGGIFLSPLLLLLGWANAKEAAAGASFFILVNSMAGLLGQFSKGGGLPEWNFLVPLGGAVFLGGQVGSRLGSRKISKQLLQRVTALLILGVAVKLLLK